MKIWISGEVFGDVSESYRIASNAVEAAINGAIADRDYGPGVAEWMMIMIVLPEELGFDELGHYHARKREVEFRLKIDHAMFKAANPQHRRQLLVECISRSIALLPSLKVPAFDAERFERDVAQIIA